MKTCVSQFLSSRSWRFWSSWLPAFSTPIHDLEIIVFLSRSIFGSQKQNVCEKKGMCRKTEWKTFFVIVCDLKINAETSLNRPRLFNRIILYPVGSAIHLLNNWSLLFINNTKMSMLLWSCISTFWLSSTWAQNDDNIRNIDRNFMWLFSITISVQ